MESERPRPEFFEAYFTVELPPEGLPSRFGVVTAHNPRSLPASAEANARADAALRRHLIDAGLHPFRVIGGSRDGSHREPGFGVAAESPEAIRPISRRFEQDAFFWIEEGVIYVINTESETRHRVDAWAARLQHGS